MIMNVYVAIDLHINSVWCRFSREPLRLVGAAILVDFLVFQVEIVSQVWALVTRVDMTTHL